MVKFTYHSRRWRITLVLMVTIGLAVPLGRFVRASRWAAQDRQCAAYLDGVFLALLNYEDVYGQLPAAICCDNRGRPLFGWRFALIPFLESACGDAQFDMPWDDPANAPWSQTAPAIYCLSQASRATRSTNLAAVTGAGTAFDPVWRRPMADLPPATVVLITVTDSKMNWMEPGADVSVNDVPSLIGGGVYGRGVFVEFADGLIWQLRRDVPVGLLTKFFTIDAARENDRDAVLRPYLIDEYEGPLYRLGKHALFH